MPPMSRAVPLATAAVLLAMIACSLPEAAPPTAVPTATATATPTSTPSPTPSSTPTPTPSAQDLIEAGHAALLNGDWDLAIERFERVLAETGDPDLQGEAHFGRGQALYWAGRLIEAEAALWQFASDYAGSGHARLAQARLLRGDIEWSLGDVRLTTEDYQAYLELSPGVIDSYAQEWLGDALRAIGQPEQALQHYDQALQAERGGSQLPVMVKVGRGLLELGRYEEAIAQFDQVAALTEDQGTKASMNLLAADAYEGLGDPDAMYARLLDSVNRYPTAYDSYVGLVRLVSGGIPVDEFQRGYVDYYAGAYEPAIAVFDRLVAETPSAAAYYYRGLCQRALGNSLFALADFDFVVANYPDDPIWADAMFDKARTEWAYLDRYSVAADTYLQLADTLPASPAAPEAMFAAGRVAERVNDLARAGQIWLDLTARYPGSGYAAQAGFQAGIVLYRSGDYPGARAAFESMLQLPVGVRDRSAAHLWVGKAYAAEGAQAEAEAAWTQAAASDPTGYYSERAEQLLDGVEPFQRSGSFNFNTDLETERQQAEDWLRATFGIQSSGSLSSLEGPLATDPGLIRAQELWELGRWEEARVEVRALRDRFSGDAESTFRLMHRLLELGFYREAIFASRHILDLAGMDDAGTLQAPVYFNRIRFGAYFGDLILPAAANNGFDGLFLLSVVRQESLFEGFAISSASARGLMQVIPPTGESIAAQLGWPPDYQESDLYRPIVSVRFGTHYLATQRDRFEGDLYAALSAYNAGPGNAIIWKELAPDDPDLYLEVIRLDQPHIYIQVIFEVYEIYRSLYGAG